jgi:hypothetical protein
LWTIVVADPGLSGLAVSGGELLGIGVGIRGATDSVLGLSFRYHAASILIGWNVGADWH